mgnify:CR=1 FL=1
MKVDKTDVRVYTRAVFELIDEGMVDPTVLVKDSHYWMSEADVEQYANTMLIDYFMDVDDEEEKYEPLVE